MKENAYLGVEASSAHRFVHIAMSLDKGNEGNSSGNLRQEHLEKNLVFGSELV